MGASHDDSGAAERLQFTAGEGPCLTAHAEGYPVVADEAQLSARWPAFASALLARTPIRGVVALPLGDGLQGVGVLDLYLAAPHRIGDLYLADALEVAREVTRVFQESSAGSRAEGQAWLDAPGMQRRARVWQAMGFLNASLEVDGVDALALLRGFAFSRDTDVDTVAGQVLDGSLPVWQLAPEADVP